MKKRCAVIVRMETCFKKWEKLCFFHSFFQKRDKLYSKITEILPALDTDFYILHLPIAEKKRQEEYIEKYIEDFSKKTKASEIYFKKYNEKRNKHVCKMLCGIYDYRIQMIKKYAKQNKVCIKNSRIILLCDSPAQAEPFLKKLCKEVFEIELYLQNCSGFEETVQYFLSEYGILLKTEETISERNKENTLAVSVSENDLLIKKFLKEGFLPVLNLSNRKTELFGVYEKMIFSGNKDMNHIASKCGKFDFDTLCFLFKSFTKKSTNEEWSLFLKNFDIKCIKIVKND